MTLARESVSRWILIPDRRIPYRRIPDRRIPDRRIPGRWIPDRRIPGRWIPDRRIPDTQIPDTRIPDTRIPDRRVPDTGWTELLNSFEISNSEKSTYMYSIIIAHEDVEKALKLTMLSCFSKNISLTSLMKHFSSSADLPLIFFVTISLLYCPFHIVPYAPFPICSFSSWYTKEGKPCATFCFDIAFFRLGILN